MEKNSQENTIHTAESIEAVEIIVDIYNFLSETKVDTLRRTKQHRKNIDRIIVSQYIHQYVKDQYVEDNYAVTYSREDNSFLGWTINIEQNGHQHPDVYFKLDHSYNIKSFKLCKNTLLFYYEVGGDYRKYLF